MALVSASAPVPHGDVRCAPSRHAGQVLKFVFECLEILFILWIVAVLVHFFFAHLQQGLNHIFHIPASFLDRFGIFEFLLKFAQSVNPSLGRLFALEISEAFESREIEPRAAYDSRAADLVVCNAVVFVPPGLFHDQ